jgi:hypothetical protein
LARLSDNWRKIMTYSSGILLAIKLAALRLLHIRWSPDGALPITRLVLIAVVGLSVFAHTTFALQQTEADEAIKRFLSSQKSDGEDTDSQGTAIADLNGDGKSEIVLVWTVLGPTYSHNTLTVFSKTASGYKPVASLPLAGEATLNSVKGGIIVVDQTVYGKNDPLCCPSIKKRVKYRWLARKISEVK